MGQVGRAAENQGGRKMKQRGIYEKLPGSGIWWVRYADGNGRIRREKTGAKSSAIQLYRKRKTEILQGKKLPERLWRRVISFEELVKDALVYSEIHKRSYRDDACRCRTLLNWFAKRAADSITAREIEQRLAEGVQGGWKPATANRYRALLSLIFRLGTESGRISENPARLVKHRWENNARTRYLSPTEERRLREAIEEKHAEHMPELDLALNTGLRLSELYGFVWENVNLARRVLTVPRSKNGEIRHVPLNQAAIAALKVLRGRSDRTGPVIRNQEGVSLAGPRHWFEPAVADAEVKDFTWHCLRHTFASRLVMAGVDIRTVQELLGHKQISMTVRSPTSPRPTSWRLWSGSLAGQRRPHKKAQLTPKLAPASLSKSRQKEPMCTNPFRCRMLVRSGARSSAVRAADS